MVLYNSSSQEAALQRWNNLPLLKRFGRMGVRALEKHRRVFMLGTLIFVGTACIGTALGVCGIFSGVLQHLYWAKGTVTTKMGSNTTTFFLGLKDILKVQEDAAGVTSTSTIAWKSVDCSAQLSPGAYVGDGTAGDFCSQCADSAHATMQSAGLLLVASIMCVRASIKRTSASRDTNLTKFLAVWLMGMVSLVTGSIALAKFSHGCYESAPREFGFTVAGSSITQKAQASYSYGPGFILIFFATLLKVIHIITHTCLPVPRPEEDVDLPDPYMPSNDANLMRNVAQPPMVEP